MLGDIVEGRIFTQAQLANLDLPSRADIRWSIEDSRTPPWIASQFENVRVFAIREPREDEDDDRGTWTTLPTMMANALTGSRT